VSDIRDPYEAERLAFTEPEAFATRREFLMRTARSAGLAAAMGLALDPDTIVAEAARVQRRVALPSPRNMPIDTIVVLMMENRSFDHYLGWLPGADGRQAGLQYADGSGKTFSTHRLTPQFQGCAYLDPDHSWDGGRTEFDGGKMDGFLRAQSDIFSIGYYEEPDLGFTPSAAKAFTVFDRYFCSLLSSTYPNREYMHAGQSYGYKDNSLPIASAGFPANTIFDSLSRKGVSNRYYFTDIPISVLWGTSGLLRSGQVQEYYERCAAGTLPAVSYVDPSFNGEDQGTSGDEHPWGDVRVGQAFISDVVHAFMESPQWKRGALFVVYDEWGGFFDHVTPPRVPDIRASRDPAQDFGQMGLRIPVFVASPYARRGYVDHSIYGHESILKLIRYRYGLAPLTLRDLYANNIGYAFDFEHPNFDVPALPKPARILPAPCAHQTPIDTGGVGVGIGAVIGQPLLFERDAAPERPKQHDAVALLTSGYLERFGFRYRPVTPATMWRHPSSMGMRA
jgi:phospholipase C